MGLIQTGFDPVAEISAPVLPSSIIEIDKKLFGRNGFVKRLSDILISGLALVALAPLFLIIMLIVRTTSPGPIFYTQMRVGMHDRLFPMLKFRTMYTDGDDLLDQLLLSCPRSAAEWQEYQKLRHDPRITRPGNFLRKSSLDELPQLINVFIGHMSIVGQRPLLPAQKFAYGQDNFRHYARARPGITGLWQVSGRNQLSFQKRAQLDTQYSRTWSLINDLKLLLKTVPVVLFFRGAF